MPDSRSDLRYRRLFETIHIGIILLDFKTCRITDANAFITNLSGYPLKELIGARLSDIGLFDKIVTGKKIFDSLRIHPEVIYDNTPLITKNGQVKIVEVSAHTYESNGVTMVQCVVRDLTEKRRVQTELFETNQRIEALLNALPVGVTFSLDPKCERVIANPYLTRIMELSTADISVTPDAATVQGGRVLRHFMNGKELKPKDLTMQRAIAQNKEVGPFEIEVELPSGKRWLMEAKGAPIHDKTGKVIGAVAVNVDLTERKKAEEADRLARVVEQEKMKLDFVADAAHELRTPLAIIRGNVDLALRGKADTNEVLKAINGEVMHLTGLLSDLSLLTTKEREFRKSLGSHQVALGQLIMSVAKRHESFANDKNISIEIDPLPKNKIIGDEFYLERLFTNIIANAISYGKRDGFIKIKGKVDGKCFHIMIEDNGIGIAEKDLSHIFERFYRAESSRSKDYGGSGLGLAIVKWIAEAHSGSVSAKSTLGKGTTFTVSFPITRKAA